jgi:DNA/RNA endonuclease YhcR with UshA esterase domain
MVLVRQEKIALVLILAVIATVAIATFILESVGKGAFVRSMGPEAREGDLVSLQGSVEEVRATATGGHQVLRVAGVRVFVPATAVRNGWPRVGDEIRVFGTIQTYRGEREVLVRSAGDITAVSPT